MLFWRPQLALLVNEQTLFPVLMPLAPTASLLDRFPAALAETLATIGVGRRFIDAELAEMGDAQWAKTANRSVTGVMNEFSFLANDLRWRREVTDPIEVALWLAQTPCGPLYERHISPDRELAAAVASWSAEHASGRTVAVPYTWIVARRPSEDDRVEAIRRLLSGLENGADAHELAAAVAGLHPKNNTFPGEVFMEVAADALDLAGISRDTAIPYEGLLDAHLPECQFRGRENRKIQYAILTSAALRAGLEPNLLDEVVWWQTDDYWRYALFAAVGLIRAGAARQGIPAPRLARQLAERHGVASPP